MAERLHWQTVGPVRTCVGCRQRDQQSDLLRMVARGSEVIPDDRVRQPGRGAYLHPRLECLSLAERRRSLARALRAPGPLSTTALAERLQHETKVRGSGNRDEPPMTSPSC